MFGLGYDTIEVLAMIFLGAGFAVALSGWVFQSIYINLFRPSRPQWLVLLAGCLFMIGLMFSGIATGPKAKQAWITQHSAISEVKK